MGAKTRFRWQKTETVTAVFQGRDKCFTMRAPRIKKRNQIQKYFLNKIGGVCVWLDRRGGEEVTENGLKVFSRKLIQW